MEKLIRRFLCDHCLRYTPTEVIEVARLPKTVLVSCQCLMCKKLTTYRLRIADFEAVQNGEHQIFVVEEHNRLN